MRALWCALRHFLVTAFLPRLSVQEEVVALRHQLPVYERSRPKYIRMMERSGLAVNEDSTEFPRLEYSRYLQPRIGC